MVDGRESRWRGHNRARRLALLVGTIDAVRTFGCDIGIDRIASANGVSTSFLYKHFSSKDELVQAAVAHYVETIYAPRIRAAASSGQDEFERTRAIISIYIDALLSGPELHRFSLANNLPGYPPSIASESEPLIAESLSADIEECLCANDMDHCGAQPLAFGLIGAVRLTVQWWVTSRSIEQNALVEYLSIMLLGGITGHRRIPRAQLQVSVCPGAPPVQRSLESGARRSRLNPSLSLVSTGRAVTTTRWFS
ncbi:TetR/AcrR family transcriptional regulator [Rhodococcoides fascians]|uniref:TetR/AcrR family transcriptional regulator n=1 Tax=Rhodococcoides fascians TaxID=1828 RepID=UPI00068D439C|nr:TetR/AcrR family transcriptional regulator [Rhodococcus fascians]